MVSERIAWYVNDRIHGVATPADIAPWPWVFDEKPFYLIVNMAVGGTLGGEVVPQDLPATVEFDWIRVYPAGPVATGLSSAIDCDGINTGISGTLWARYLHDVRAAVLIIGA
jgi:beta-glucanase (GH16 family)